MISGRKSVSSLPFPQTPAQSSESKCDSGATADCEPRNNVCCKIGHQTPRDPRGKFLFIDTTRAKSRKMAPRSTFDGLIVGGRKDGEIREVTGEDLYLLAGKSASREA